MGLVGNSRGGLRAVAADGRRVVKLFKAIAAAIGLVLLLWGTGCAHKLRTTDNAQRTEETNTTWQAGKTAVEQQQSVETTKTATKRVTERFRPDGTLLERMTEKRETDGVVRSSSRSRSDSHATGTNFRSVIASSSSTRASDTKVGLPSPLWLLLLVPLAAGGWALKHWGLPRIPFLGR